MSRSSRAIWLAVALAAGFAWGVLHLLRVEFEAGDIYPEYSSLRSDALGSKMLCDSLARLPGLSVARSYVPLDLLEEHAATVLLLGTGPYTLDESESLDRIAKAARRGNRVVVALALPKAPERRSFATLQTAWQVRLQLDANQFHSRRLYFTEAKGWKVLDRMGSKLLGIERAFGAGSVVLFAESDAFANHAMITGPRLEMIASVIGENTRIVFDEAHAGIVESGSVMELARRYRLTGLLLGLAICAALALWKHASPFPPPRAPGAPDRMLARTSVAGLVALLRRHVPPDELAPACWQEWLKSNRRRVPAERVARAAAIARTASPLDAVREIQTVLHTKGAE